MPYRSLSRKNKKAVNPSKTKSSLITLLLRLLNLHHIEFPEIILIDTLRKYLGEHLDELEEQHTIQTIDPTRRSERWIETPQLRHSDVDSKSEPENSPKKQIDSDNPPADNPEWVRAQQNPSAPPLDPEQQPSIDNPPAYNPEFTAQQDLHYSDSSPSAPPLDPKQQPSSDNPPPHNPRQALAEQYWHYAFPSAPPLEPDSEQQHVIDGNPPPFSPESKKDEEHNASLKAQQLKPAASPLKTAPSPSVYN